MRKRIEKVLIEGSESLGVHLDSFQLALFLQYYDILCKWNTKINLTSIRTPQEIIVKHFLDSLTCVKIIKTYINSRVNGRKGISIIDVGTGAGFPGVPLKIMIPSLKMTLLEANEKKTDFLKKLVKELDVRGIKIIKNRAEIIGKKIDFRESYDISISRAVAPLSVLSEYSLPLVKKNGWFVAQKGREYKEELRCSMKAFELLGGALIKI
ncbi:MAG: 16S rRNA (guanine(527)-N(7))-methyltransferase RsmG, partial [Candidatus Caldatribacteriota bacterium]|nr:16S rRNA (guanine(527)-N(7))-methyltransferase RsmG [Candidatus Caldatribacteriota bacterium]